MISFQFEIIKHVFKMTDKGSEWPVAVPHCFYSLAYIRKAHSVEDEEKIGAVTLVC